MGVEMSNGGGLGLGMEDVEEMARTDGGGGWEVKPRMVAVEVGGDGRSAGMREPPRRKVLHCAVIPAIMRLEVVVIRGAVKICEARDGIRVRMVLFDLFWVFVVKLCLLRLWSLEPL